MMGPWRGFRDIELFSSLLDNVRMGRPKSFSREDVLEKAMPVLWKRGFAGTSLQNLEQATGVNKSGLYTEFRDKKDLFLGCLRHYLESLGERELLTKEPLGWKNVETFLRDGPVNKADRQGCFGVNSMREFAILPDEAQGAVAESRAQVLRQVARKLRSKSPRWLHQRLRRWCCRFSPDCASSATSNPAKCLRPGR